MQEEVSLSTLNILLRHHLFRNEIKSDEQAQKILS